MCRKVISASASRTATALALAFPLSCSLADIPGTTEAHPTAAGKPAGLAAEGLASQLGRTFDNEDPDDCARRLHLPWGMIKRCESAILAASGAGLGLVAYVKWWRKGIGTHWTTADEGWFGRHTYAGGIDKLAHGYSLYVGTRLLTRGLDWANRPHELPVRTAATFGLGAALAIEVFDGLSKKGYGFSKEDLVSGAIGVGLAVLMETRPELDRYVAFRLMYRAPILSHRLPQPLDDYQRQVYLVAFRPSGFRALGPRNPLGYLEILAGYGARGFGVEGGAPPELRRRVLYLGIGIDLTRVVQSMFFGTAGGNAEAATVEALRYLQPPGTALWSKTNL